ncbi:MAG: DNA gyrase inhibitor YacG [Acidobacteria bacterium]|nr:MAG: DNA gyrase inhibitor YacG [Acidobacteriota bacterium]
MKRRSTRRPTVRGPERPLAQACPICQAPTLSLRSKFCSPRCRQLSARRHWTELREALDELFGEGEDDS